MLPSEPIGVSVGWCLKSGSVEKVCLSGQKIIGTVRAGQAKEWRGVIVMNMNPGKSLDHIGVASQKEHVYIMPKEQPGSCPQV